MTNLQVKEPLPPLQAFLTRERILWGVPALLGGLLALGTLALLVWPSWQKLQNDQAQLDQLNSLSDQIPQLRLKLEESQVGYGTSQRLQASLLSLIAGSGDISTFMAQIGAEASRSGVLLDSFEPNQVAPGAQPGASPAPPAAPPAPADPLLAPGLQKTDLLITANGSAPNLLTFLRRLEALSLLVVQSDLSLKQQAGVATAGSSPVATSSATLKLKLTLYSKQAPATPPTPPTPARS
jgi:type IV pilus assembly protein PilO